MSLSNMNPLGQALLDAAAVNGVRRAASDGNTGSRARLFPNYPENICAGLDLSLDSVSSDVALESMSVKMDLVGKGQDKARGAMPQATAALGGARRVRATLPANFRLTFDPNTSLSRSGSSSQLTAAAAGPPIARGHLANAALVAQRGAAAHAAAAAAAAAGPAGAEAFGGGGISLTEAGGRRNASRSIKERIEEEEEEMAVNMSLHGNPFGPRVSDRQALNSFDWLVAGSGAGFEPSSPFRTEEPAAAAARGM